MTIHEITDTRRMENYMRFASVDGRLGAMLLAFLFALSVFSLPSSANQSNGTSAVQFVDVSAAVGLAVIEEVAVNAVLSVEEEAPLAGGSEFLSRLLVGVFVALFFILLALSYKVVNVAPDDEG